MCVYTLGEPLFVAGIISMLDVNGQILSVGCTVKVLSVESCASGLPIEDQERLRAIVGKSRQIVEFDCYGFAWLCFDSNGKRSGDFCVFPNELLLVKIA